MKDIVLEHDSFVTGKLEYKHLLGRKFEMGVNDCGSMLINMFKDNLNIKLTNYARPTNFWRFEGINPYVDNYHKEGFRLIDEPQLKDLRPFDVFLIAIPDPSSLVKTVTNHCAIYLGEGLIIHHRLGEFSKVEMYKGSLRHLTTHIIRHKDVPDLRQAIKVETLDLMQYILPHKRAQYMEILNGLKQTE